MNSSWINLHLPGNVWSLYTCTYLFVYGYNNQIHAPIKPRNGPFGFLIVFHRKTNVEVLKTPQKMRRIWFMPWFLYTWKPTKVNAKCLLRWCSAIGGAVAALLLQAPPSWLNCGCRSLLNSQVSIVMVKVRVIPSHSILTITQHSTRWK